MNWQTIELPFRAGLQQGTDDRARPNPFLDICKDAQFDELGGLQTRYPFGATMSGIFGGGTLANCRRVERYGDELVLFTNDSLYSWNDQQQKFVLRGTHLAVKIDEDPAFATTGDQIDGDRAELGNTVVFAWVEGTSVYAAANDKLTGSVLVTPTLVSTALSRPRLVALATKILFFVASTATDLAVRAIDPATPGTGIAGASTSVLAANFNLYFDVVKVGGQDLCVGACRRLVTTSYQVFTVTPALVIATVTKARTCDGPIAVSTIPAGASTQVVRANATNIQGDFLTTSTLADVTVNQAIGTVAGVPVNQIAACHRSVTTAGAFRCYVFWDEQETTGSSVLFLSKFNFVDSAGTIGTQATFYRLLGIASRAFDFNGSVYVWGVFAAQAVFSGANEPGFRAQLQNTYFLFRDDGFLCAKALTDRAGGLQPSIGRLPGVALTSGTTGYAWCGTQRRVIEQGGEHLAFAARTPCDVTVTFDSNEARRCARIGRTLYIASGEILQYDSTRITELGFHVYPYDFGLIDAGGGSIAVGKYAYKLTWRSENAVDELDRSTTATVGVVTVSGSSTSIPNGKPLFITHRTAVVPAIEVWRTAVAPNPESPFFLVSSKDPGVITNPNRYLQNDTTVATFPTFNDFMADGTATALEANPENIGDLENLAPPPAAIIIATDTRVYLFDVAGDTDFVWYSKQRREGQVVAFHDQLRAAVPRPGGRPTALVIHNETLVAFRQTAIYRLPGEGLNNLGLGQNFIAFPVADDVGAVNHESVARTPLGIVFKSAKGWYLLDPGWNVQYIGAAMKDYDAEAVLAVHVVETQHQVRILTSGRMLIWDYAAATAESPIGQWGEWTISDGLHATIWNGAHVYLTATGPKQQLTTYTGLTYGMDVETADIKTAGLQGAVAVRKMSLLGEHRSAFSARIRAAYNYKRTAGVPDYVDDKVWPSTPAVVGGPLQVKHGFKRSRCEAFKVRITAVVAGNPALLDTGSLLPVVTTSGADWAASWAAVAVGTLGNLVTLQLAFADGPPPFSIDVRDHFVWSAALGIWTPAINSVGVLVTCRAGSSPTVAQLEAAIAAGNTLITLSVADVTPGKIVNAAALAGTTSSGVFTGGTFGAPTGEALKLTAIALEVGIDRGTFKRLPAAQRI